MVITKADVADVLVGTECIWTKTSHIQFPQARFSIISAFSHAEIHLVTCSPMHHNPSLSHSNILLALLSVGPFLPSPLDKDKWHVVHAEDTGYT